MRRPRVKTLKTVPLTAMLLLGVGVGLGQPAAEDKDSTLAADRQALTQKHLPIDGPGLLEFFQRRTPRAEEIKSLTAQVQQLGSPHYKVRVQATALILKADHLAKPFLLDVLQDTAASLEVVRRAELCLKQIGTGRDATLACAAARLLAHEKPAGAAAVLLAYLPFAPDDEVIAEVQHALNATTVEKGMPAAAVLRALHDAKPIRRGAAGQALVRALGLSRRGEVAHLLHDEILSVRLGVARALVDMNDKSAVPVVIDLLKEYLPDDAWQIEEVLLHIAQDRGPNVYVGRDHTPTQVHAAWKVWWKQNEATIDLAKLPERPPLQGLILLTQMGVNGINGRVCELRPNKEIVWSIDGLRYPLDAQWVGKDRVLIAEYLNRRVSERDLKGNILWEKQVDMPIGCQRLPGGQTFIVTRRQLMMVDKDGKETFSYFHRTTSIAAAARARDGRMVVIGLGGQCHWLDSQGREQKSFKVGAVYTLGGNVDVLPGGRILIPQYRDNAVVEYDQHGKVTWQASVPFPISAVRLANGNTLAASMQNQVMELARDGKVVWQYQADSRPWRARKR